MNQRTLLDFRLFSVPYLLSVLIVSMVMSAFFLPRHALAQEGSMANTQTQAQLTEGGFLSKVAPGDFLPISVRLYNFGSTQRVDVVVVYEVINADGAVVYTSHETVAVDTTASFIKAIQIPFETLPGRYIARTSITYSGQALPITSQFPFVVERKIAGLFQNDFFLYVGVVLVVSLVTWTVGGLAMKRRRSTRIKPLDYSHVPRNQRIYFEMISDTINQMRQRVGDGALIIANSVDGLVMDEMNGRVLDMKKDPAKIMALLILHYEKLLGEKVSFELHPPYQKNKTRLSNIDKNLVVINKYFT